MSKPASESHDLKINPISELSPAAKPSIGGGRSVGAGREGDRPGEGVFRREAAGARAGGLRGSDPGAGFHRFADQWYVRFFFCFQ